MLMKAMNQRGQTAMKSMKAMKQQTTKVAKPATQQAIKADTQLGRGSKAKKSKATAMKKVEKSDKARAPPKTMGNAALSFARSVGLLGQLYLLSLAVWLARALKRREWVSANARKTVAAVLNERIQRNESGAAASGARG